jgi:N-acetylmuramoyl-L-alanine amidase
MGEFRRMRFSNSTAHRSNSVAKDFKVCLDPGHGMSNRSPGVWDPGAVGGGVAEADIVLQWAKTIKHIGIIEFGVRPDQIVLTRDDHEDHLPVTKRDDIARAEGCTHFLSLHCNASANPLASGTETLYSEDKGKQRSYAFAGLVNNAAVKAVRRTNRKLKSERTTRHKDLAVFGLAAYMDAAMLEIAFISNTTDRKIMIDRNVRIAFAREFWSSVMGVKKK